MLLFVVGHGVYVDLAADAAAATLAGQGKP